ncbi:MAG: hypothetical protein V1809_01130 [Planctomycetota bacterium]
MPRIVRTLRYAPLVILSFLTMPAAYAPDPPPPAGIPGVRTVIMKTGITLEGEIVRADAVGFQIKLAKDGTILGFPWDTVSDESRRTLLEESGILRKSPIGAPLLPAEAITLENGEKYVGTPIPGRETPERVVLKRKDAEIAISRARIRLIEPVLVNALDLFTPDELYQRKLEEIRPRTPGDYRALGDYCLAINLPEKSRENLLLAEMIGSRGRKQILDTFLNARMAATEPDVRDRLDRIMAHLHEENYDKALETLGELQTRAARSSIAARYPALKAELVRHRDARLGENILQDWYAAVEQSTRIKSYGDTSYLETLHEIRTTLSGDIRDRLSERYTIPVRDVERFWADRVATTARQASYGSGSWLAEGRAGDPGAEAWWKDAPPASRAEFLKAWYAENFMSVLRIIHKDCSLCGGSGRMERVDPALGGTVIDPCDSCRGTGKYRVVVYR